MTDIVETNRGEVLLLEDDLMFGTRVERSLAKMGLHYVTVTGEAEALRLVNDHAFTMAVLNYGREGLGALRVAHAIREAGVVPILGYASHTVIPSLRPAAVAGGCTLLAPRSAVAARLPQLVERLLAGKPTEDLTDEAE